MSCSADMDRLLASLRVKLPGAVDDNIKLNLFNVIDEHARKSNAWRYVTTVSLAVNVVEYPLITPSDTALVRVLDASHAGNPVAPAQGGFSASGQRGRLTADTVYSDSDAAFTADQIIEELPASDSFRYSIYYPNYVTITLPPTESAIEQPFIIAMALTLSAGALEGDVDDWSIPPWMWDRYYHDYEAGTLGYMMAETGKPYTNLKQAAIWLQKFRQGRNFARQEAHRGFIFDRPMWRYPRLGGWINA